MIKINQLSFGYSKNKLLYQNLDLEFKPGRIYGLFGKNGAGKSTLLSNIAGLLQPTEGSILINNHLPFERKPSFLADFFLIPEEVHLPSISLQTFLSLNAVFYTQKSYIALTDYKTQIKSLLYLTYLLLDKTLYQ